MRKIIWQLSLTRRGTPLLMTAIHRGLADVRKTYVLDYWDDLTFYIYVDKKRNKENALELSKKVIADPQFNERYFKRTLKIFNNNIKEAKNLAKKEYSNLSNKQLLERLNKVYKNLYNDGTTIIVPRYHAELEVEKFIRKKLSKNQEKAARYTTTLMAPEIQSLATKEEKIFLRFAQRIKEKKLDKKEIERCLSHHIKEWAWIPTDFGIGEYWKINDLKKRLKDILRIGYHSQLKKIENEVKKIKAQKKEIIKELKIPSSIQRLAKISAITGFVRLQRRYIWPQIFYYGDKFFQEISKRLKIKNVEDLMFLTYEELSDVLKDKNSAKYTKQYNKLIQERRKIKFTVYYEPGLIRYYTGKKAINFLKSQTFLKIKIPPSQLKGTVANPGKAKGVVKKIMKITDIKKFNKSDILVATETTPDLLPIMKIANAFITDEGGLCCHAAIMSRELDKLCIIGTKIATKVLKDEDLIEVDADKGIVRILKRN